MKGTMLIYSPGSMTPKVTKLAASPQLSDLQGAVGGYIEAVPYFQTIQRFAKIQTCVAFCNEHGKLDGLPINEHATWLWYRALERNKLCPSDDVLVGSIVVLFGDREFVAAL